MTPHDAEIRELPLNRPHIGGLPKQPTYGDMASCGECQTTVHSASQRSHELLATPGALLSRTALRDLGLERRAVDAVFRALPVVVLPGYSRPLIRRDDFVAFVDANTYAGDRVRP